MCAIDILRYTWRVRLPMARRLLPWAGCSLGQGVLTRVDGRTIMRSFTARTLGVALQPPAAPDLSIGPRGRTLIWLKAPLSVETIEF